MRDEDPDFAAAWDEALASSLDDAEGELYRRAVKGTLKPVYQGGAKVGSIREYSDTLLIFLLKSHKPSVYRETTRNEHTGKDGEPIKMEDVGLTDETRVGRIISLLDRARERRDRQATSE